MSKTMKWIIAALALSIAFNVFVIGVSIGRKAADRNTQVTAGPPPGGPGFNARALGRYLDRSDRRAVRALLEDRRDEFRASRQARRTNERAIRELLVADEIDPAELSALLDENARLIIESDHAPRRMMVEFIATLDAETRRAIAQDMFKRRGDRWRPPGDRLGDRPRREDGPPPRDGGF